MAYAHYCLKSYFAYCVLSLLSANTLAQDIPRTPDGIPDLNGYWSARVESALVNIDDKPGGPPPYTAAARERVEFIRKNRMADEPELHCFMSGIPHQAYVQFGFQLIQTSDWLHWVSEFMGAVRYIALDDREHIPASVKLFNGDSIAHWEEDTLVIDTTNQNGRTWIDVYGAITSDNIHVVERLTMIDANTITWEANITDPTLYTRPWTIEGTLNRNLQEGYEQMEFACIEGNRDLDHYLESDGGFRTEAF